MTRKRVDWQDRNNNFHSEFVISRLQGTTASTIGRDTFVHENGADIIWYKQSKSMCVTVELQRFVWCFHEVHSYGCARKLAKVSLEQ